MKPVKIINAFDMETGNCIDDLHKGNIKLRKGPGLPCIALPVSECYCIIVVSFQGLFVSGCTKYNWHRAQSFGYSRPDSVTG